MNQKVTMFGRALALGLCWPTYLVTIDGGGQQATRMFLVRESCDFLDFLRQAPLGRIISVSLLISPNCPEVDAWEAIPVRYVDMLPPSGDLIFPTPMLTSYDGQLFGGIPIAALPSLPRVEPVRIAEFRRPSVSATSGKTFADLDAYDHNENRC
jgi:hypothetical protein